MLSWTSDVRKLVRLPVLVRTILVVGLLNVLFLLLLVAVAVCWIVGAARAWRDRGVEGNVDRTLLLVAAIMPLCWVLLLPRHTYIHAVFMVRILVASIALAPLAAWWPVDREGRYRAVPLRHREVS
jgi:hypothetical protein